MYSSRKYEDKVGCTIIQMLLGAGRLLPVLKGGGGRRKEEGGHFEKA